MALPTKLKLEIVTPARALLAEEVDEVVVPGSEGYFGVLPGHTPLLSMLKVGELWFRQGQEKHYLAVAFGFVEVLPDRVTVLADIGERAQDIDVQRAERAKQRAEQRLAQAQPHLTAVDLDIERARIALLKSLIRLQVASRARTRV
ncbi:MAG TPA: F0F1 ATP synthase subunit epsilon [Vicinamibacterales bacterium]|nr:F0F1 ATP synthase subunit epsilon [Vicinamibacterales bacterium]